MNALRSLFLAIPLLGLAACNGGRGQPPPVANAVPVVNVLAPLVNVAVEAGAAVEIRYADSDPDTVARTDVVALSVLTLAEIAIAMDLPEADGAEQTVTWDTTGVAADTYRIEIRSDDGESETVVTAPGNVTVSEPPPPPAESGVWADNANVKDMAVFPDGSLVVTGEYGTETTLGTDQPGQTTLVGAPTGATYFVARYQADGTLLWARTAASSIVGTRGFAVDAFPDGSCIVLGLFGAETTLNPGRPDARTLGDSPFLRDNVFVARYDANGALVWVDAIRSENNLPQGLLHVAAVPDGSAIVGGLYHQEVLTFNEGRATEAVVQDESAFGAKYGPDGTVLWARNLVTQGRAVAAGLAAFDDGSFVACGAYDNRDIVLGEGEPGETLLPDDGDNGWVARFHADGTLDWARRASTLNGQFSFIEPDVSGGAVVVTGFYRTAQLSVAPGTPSAAAIDLPGQIGGIVARFEADGAFAWMVDLENAFVDNHGLACDTDASCVVTMQFLQDLRIAPGTADETVLPGDNPRRMLATMRFGADGALLWARSDAAEGTLSENTGGVGVLPGGQPVVAGTFLTTVTIGAQLLEADDFVAFFVAVFGADGTLDP